MVGKPVQYDELLVTVFICVIGGLLLIVGLGIYFENELTSFFFGGEASSAAKPSGGADDASGRRASVPAADSSGPSRTRSSRVGRRTMVHGLLHAHRMCIRDTSATVALGSTPRGALSPPLVSAAACASEL